ncbi:hypothetical protein B0E41_20715 [Hydrogenophaga sp. A37]|nr:hypothetical protein B0E41_20715 [Hydrogenophaga sp. A37]
MFAGKFKATLHDAGLSLPAVLPEPWVVDCKAVGDGQAALRYLGRYLYRGVISENDILRCQDGLVSFRYRDAKSDKPATRTLPGADFLWLLQHVLPKGLQRARNFGFLHHNSRRTLHLLQLSHRVPTQTRWRTQDTETARTALAPARLEPGAPRAGLSRASLVQHSGWFIWQRISCH